MSIESMEYQETIEELEKELLEVRKMIVEWSVLQMCTKEANYPLHHRNLLEYAKRFDCKGCERREK